ncbi:hypothetical protein ADK59_03135 [Streptomyces sp. XY332]|nr:hypothetical protein ADK59_03135 [Streptomyces sp. XY332]
MRDAVLLARVRRLTELGLSLDEVRDVLADDAGRDLAGRTAATRTPVTGCRTAPGPSGGMRSRTP